MEEEEKIDIIKEIENTMDFIDSLKEGEEE